MVNKLINIKRKAFKNEDYTEENLIFKKNIIIMPLTLY